MSYFKMSKLALKWAFKKPSTTQYPFKPRDVVEGSRGRLEFTKDGCVYCNVCAKKCPTNAIEVVRADKRWAIDRLRCVHCGYCVEICPKGSLQLDTDHTSPTTTRDREVH